MYMYVIATQRTKKTVASLQQNFKCFCLKRLWRGICKLLEHVPKLFRFDQENILKTKKRL